MHRDKPKNAAGPGASGAGLRKRKDGVTRRTDGSPRLKAPGELGNPYKHHWAIAWTERSPGAKPRSRVITTRETEEARARDALIIFKAELDRPPEQRDITVKGICEAYIEARKAESASHGSLKSALQPIIAAFGPLNPADVQQTNLTNYIAERMKAPKRRGARGGVVIEVSGTVSRKTVKNELVMFKAACNWAKDEGWPITVPPIKKQKNATKVRKRTLSRREFGRAILALDDPRTPPHIRIFTIIAMLTGQRSGAIRLLRWEHVDFEEGMLWFTRARPDAPDNKRVLDHPMTDTLARYLREAKADALAARAAVRDREPPPLGYVVEFRFAQVKSLKTAWSKLLVRADLENVWIHDLRRTVATLSRNAGRSNADVALYLNDSEEVTERSYAHASPTLLLPMQAAIAEIMDEQRRAASGPSEER